MRPAKANAFMLFLLLFNIILTLALSLFYMQLGESARFFFTTPWFAIINQLVGFLLPVALWIKITGDKIFLPSMKLGRVNIILILALSFCLQPAMMLLSALSSLFVPNTVAGVLSDWQSYPLAVSLAAIALTPALCEEITFRGYILSQLSGAGIRKAAFVSGLFFAMMHLNAQQFLYAFIMGVIFAYFVYYTRSIRASVLAHFFINAVQLLINQLLITVQPEDAALNAAAMAMSSREIWQTALYMSAVSLIFLPAVVILFRTFITHNRQRNIKHDMYERIIAPSENGVEPPDLTEPPQDAKVFGVLFWGAAGVYVLFMAAFWPG